MNNKFQNALAGVAQSCPPIWFMRQAGRYHVHYQKLRREHSFMELCKNPKLAAEVALGPIEDFDFDVSILFSDLLFPLEALGMGLTYDPAPKLAWRLNADSIHNLRPVAAAIEDLHFQKLAMQETRRVLPADKSLIGFVGGPWTLFTYASEGEHKGALVAAKTHLDLFATFLKTMVPLLKLNIELQLQGGAEVVMIFDTAAGELSPGLFREFIAPSLTELAHQFPGRLGYYAKGTTEYHTSEMRRDPLWAGFGIDHRWEMADQLVKRSSGFLQGNFDQALLFSSPNQFERALHAYLKPICGLSERQRRSWVCGLGHGVLPGTPEANVRSFVKTVREVLS